MVYGYRPGTSTTPLIRVGMVMGKLRDRAGVEIR